MSSSPGSSPHTTGAHRAPRRAPRSVAQHPPARYEPYLDGLFTYCLSVLCDHDDATEALGDALAVADRQYGRSPTAEGERKAWLYALARWACQRKLTEDRRNRQGAHSGPRAPEPAPAADPTPEITARRAHELGLLAWPEAAGTTPEQREILELAVRHQLGPREAAAVLSLQPTAARELLASAACEVERTRAALAVVDAGDCPSVARLTGDHRVLLSAALRRELVRHVDDCPRCRRAAERVEAAGPWPGSRTPPAGAPAAPPGTPARPASAARAATPAVLPLVTAPRTAVHTAMTRAARARAAAPRLGRDGFPVDPKDRAARRGRLRARALTTTVVATVVAAPVLALWAAYQAESPADEGHEGSSVSAGEADKPGHGRPYDRYENTGSAASDSRFGDDGRTSDISVEVISDGTGMPSALPGQPVPGRITVEARSAGGLTTITLRASGRSPVAWRAGTTASWLRLSQDHGTLAPGESVTIRVFVDHRREPSGPWSERIALRPAGAVVNIHGQGSRPPSAGRPGRPGHPGHPPAHPGRPGGSGNPGHPGTGGPKPPGSPDPAEPGPSRPTDPGPTDPGGPEPTDPGGPGPTDPGSEGPGPIPGDQQPPDEDPTVPEYEPPVTPV
ncbi:hypothetical protein ACFYYH_09485 [Streptomyces sp. NPDC002018]|uniref:BACON domain-containing protein n=1 Tax=Streptomyces sp. NPDC002018 TaxID=3364629 RepID=UPI00369C0368